MASTMPSLDPDPLEAVAVEVVALELPLTDPPVSPVPPRKLGGHGGWRLLVRMEPFRARQGRCADFDLVQALEGNAATLLAGRPGGPSRAMPCRTVEEPSSIQPIREQEFQDDEAGHGGDGGSPHDTATKPCARTRRGPASVP
jgi:hypothetical protein